MSTIYTGTQNAFWTEKPNERISMAFLQLVFFKTRVYAAKRDNLAKHVHVPDLDSAAQTNTGRVCWISHG